jgi:hypothetical protein
MWPRPANLFLPSLLLALLVGLVVACQPGVPTLAALAPTPVVLTAAQAEGLSIPTWTLTPEGVRPTLALTRFATPTPFPTATPFPRRTPTPEPAVVAPAASPTFAPTAPGPSPTPRPTLNRPPLPTPRAGSKLGLHVIRNNSPLIMDFVRRAQPAVIKAVGDVGWLTDVKNASPETVTVGRLMPTSQDMVGDPLEAAADFVAEQLPTYLLNPGIDYWEGWNEPDPDDDMRWYAAFEAERVRLLAEYGLRAAVGGFSAGVPELSQFYYFLQAVEAAQRYGGILSLHEYAAPTMDYLYGDPLPGYPTYPDRGPLALRYRWIYRDILIPRGTVVPLVISEAGIDGIVMHAERPGPQGLGWQDFTGYWESIGLGSGPQAYINQLAWYDSEVRRDPYVLGFTVFTAGAVEGWQTYDVNSILPELTAYVLGAR